MTDSGTTRHPADSVRSMLLPLLPEQRMAHFHSALAPDSPAYNCAMRLRLTGPLEVGAFISALQAVVDRNRTFRGFIEEIGGEAFLGIKSDVRLRVQQIDVSRFAPEKARKRADAFTRDLILCPFDLRAEVLLRAALVRFSAAVHELVLVSHHFALDGLSFRVLLIREIAELYEARREGRADPSTRPDPFASPAPLFADGGRSAEFWQRALRDAPHLLRLKGSKSDGGNAERAGGMRRIMLTPETTEALRGSCRAVGATLFAGIVAGFAEVLHAHSETDDIILGTAVSVRPDVGLETSIGPFANLLPIRSRRPRPESPRAAIRRIASALSEVLEHQNAPFDEIVANTAPRRRAGQHPLVQAMCVLHQDDPAEHFVVPGIRAEYEPIATGAARFDFALEVSQREAGIELALEFARSRISTTHAGAILQQTADVLASLATAGEPAARTAQTDESSGIRTVFASRRPCLTAADVLLHAPLSEYARTRASAPVVVDPRLTLTFRQLDWATERLAWQLRDMGASPDAPVAIAARKGWEQITAVFAVLRAGAPYAPIDAGLPPARFLRLLERSRAGICIIDDGFPSSIKWPAGVIRVPVGRALLSDAGPSSRGPLPDVSPQSIAYLMFTSGSTGEPKGVMVSHRAAANTVTAVNEIIGANSDDRWFASTPLSFDLSVYDLFGAVAAGGALVLPCSEPLRDPDRWARLADRQHVTILNTVPALMRIFLERSYGLGALRVALLSGDVVPPALVSALFRCKPSLRVLALGGSTEASIWTTVFETQPADAERSRIPYGRPLPRQGAAVLNQKLLPAGVGEIGEIYFGGAGLADGYWRDPDRTAEVFMRHPQTGERIYRTGDLGQLEIDGTIGFLGRVDRQVKIRGYRVELGEVESELRTCPSVKDVCVIASGPSEDRLLIAYVVGDGSQAFPDCVRDYAAKNLPGQLQPAFVVPLKEIPLTGNGKPDLAALPPPAATVDVETAPPETAMQRLVLDVWSEVLQTTCLGPDSEFFESGGTSFSLLRMSSLLEARLDRKLPVAELFTCRTVRAMAAYLEPGDKQRSRRAAAQERATRRLRSRLDRRRTAKESRDDNRGGQ